jgi:hypothetical protein
MTPALQLCALLVVLVVSQGFRLRQGVQAGRGSLVVPRASSRLQRLYSSVKLFEDDDEGEFRRVCENYLDNKYKDCKEGVEGSLECRFACDRTEIETLLLTLLPPVTKTELKREVDLTMQRFKGMATVDAKDFYDAVISNSFWEEAGPLVVKELIYLDSLYAFYRNKQMFLGDDEYNSLKDMLTWEGSSIVSMKGNEALFVTAVAAYLRGKPILGDEEYSKLKESLKSEQSWVVERKQDSLEKLGLNTFIGYLHRSL